MNDIVRQGVILGIPLQGSRTIQKRQHSWLDQLWPDLEVPLPAEVPQIAAVKVEYSPKAILLQRILHLYYESYAVEAMSINVLSHAEMYDQCYNRDFRTLRLEMLDKLMYELGDAWRSFRIMKKTKSLPFLMHILRISAKARLGRSTTSGLIVK
jgi:hypothetical protein